MKISIVTPHSVYNYGAVLQAYGLYRYLKEKGHDVYMQDFPAHKGGSPKSLHEKVYVLARGIFRIIYNKSIKAAENSFNQFISNFQLTTKNDMELYIVGSDQVWNPANIDGVFALDFAKEDSVKVSYAASMGVTKIENTEESKFYAILNRLDFLSAREQTTADEVKRITGRECSVEIDPTFLLDVEVWRSLEKAINITEPYTLLYILHVPSNINDIIAKIKKQYHSDVLIIDQMGGLSWGIHGAKGIRNVGPSEFLWLFDHAERIVTTSFHGTAFSIIFKKEFASIYNKMAPSRILNILTIVGLENNGFASGEEIIFNQIDYSQVDEKLKKIKESSKKYLATVIENANTKKYK